ncbi:MAG TPA: ScyD/ScyE family protein [Gaiellales bacterium]|nr:ScyD/ScyE family protein [Gaiellales bacterium]
MKRTTLAAASLAVAAGLVAGGGAASAASHTEAGTHAARVSVFATGFNNPRGLVFGPNGNLYVAEGGLGGSHSTVGQCRQASGAAAPYTGSSGNPVLGGRISQVTPAGVRSVVVRGLPSSQTSPALGSLVSGVSSVAFVGHHLYALLAGAGCSHGVPGVPNGVIRVGRDGSWSLIANLSRFQRTHPVAHPEADDFEPDGTWFSMIAVGRALYPMDSNHGELDRVTPNGRIHRVVDISAQLGHVVPTALVNHHGRFSFGNLGLFGSPDGTAPNEHVWDINRRGSIMPRASGLEQVLGLAFRHGRLYALEMSTTPGGPTPGTGALVRLQDGRPVQTIASGLDFPTGVTVGPDGAFYVSDRGFGFGAGEGRILRIAP